jgi:hypothetical protein
LDTSPIAEDRMMYEFEIIAQCREPEQTTPVRLAPARVRHVEGTHIEVDWLGQSAKALVAIAHMYKPAIGDCVLCISQGGACYIIGVLQASGKITLVAPGDVDIHAPRGSIGLSAKTGIHIKTADLSLSAGTLTVSARSVIERFTDATRWITNALQVRAGRIRTVVMQDYRVKADRIVQRADHDVKIDGEQIHLG